MHEVGGQPHASLNLLQSTLAHWVWLKAALVNQEQFFPLFLVCFILHIFSEIAIHHSRQQSSHHGSPISASPLVWPFSSCLLCAVCLSSSSECHPLFPESINSASFSLTSVIFYRFYSAREDFAHNVHHSTKRKHRLKTAKGETIQLARLGFFLHPAIESPDTFQRF